MGVRAPRKALGAAASFAFASAFALAPLPAHAEDWSGGAGTWTAKPSVSLQSMLGARASVFSGTGTEPAFGGGISTQQSGYVNYRPVFLTLRAVSLGALGSSAEGFEGVQSGDVSLGVLVPVGEDHGPFLRVGLRGYMLGNEAVWLSNFEVPAGYLGYQLQDGHWLLEAAGRTGMVVTGRHTHYAQYQGFDVLERRRLGQPSLEVGGHAAFGYDGFRAEVEYMRIGVADTIGTPLHAWTVSACFRQGSLGGCLDYRRWEADVPRIDGSISPLTVGYGGLSIGFWSP
jgi:hypothetical protein